MNYFIWNGVNSLSFGVVAEKLPAPIRDRQRVEKLTIAGRDGYLTLDDDVFDGSLRMVECGLLDVSEKHAVFDWLRGAGTVVFSNDLTRAYRARIDDQISMERVSALFQSFNVTFDCQPFAYEATPSVETLTSTGSITNIGTRYSNPIITVTGTGTLTVGAYELVVTETGVTIDSEIEECYKAGVNKNSKVSGGFPRLAVGTTDITLGAGITAVEIVGNWRWH